jgi:hypothetical protein
MEVGMSAGRVIDRLAVRAVGWTASESWPRLDSKEDAVRGDQQREPREAKEPSEDDVGEPVVAEEYPAESHHRCPGHSQQDAQGDT